MSDRQSSGDADRNVLLGSAHADEPSLFEVAQTLAQVGSWMINLANDQRTYSRECFRIWGLPNESMPSDEGFLARVGLVWAGLSCPTRWS